MRALLSPEFVRPGMLRSVYAHWVEGRHLFTSVEETSHRINVTRYWRMTFCSIPVWAHTQRLSPAMLAKCSKDDRQGR
jgi:hypothetical protein